MSMPPTRRILLPLMQMLLLSLRGAAALLLVAGMILPMGIVAAQAALPLATPATRAWLLGESVMLPPLGVALIALPVTLAEWHGRGTLGFWAGMPVSRSSWLAALVAVITLVTLPGMILAPLLATRLAHPAPAFSFWIAPVALVAIAAFLAIGLVLGFSGMSPITTLATGTLLCAACVAGMLLAPMPHLAGFAATLADLSPATMGVDLAAATVLHGGAHRLALDLLGLLALGGGFGYLAVRRIPWRGAPAQASIAARRTGTPAERLPK